MKSAFASGFLISYRLRVAISARLARHFGSGQSQVGRYVALDQDELSLQVVQNELSDRGVIPVCSSIKALFRGELAREKFDFIYSTGLYDYLDDRVATKLTHRMFEMLNPGGRLVVANFLPDIWGAGYMETFMDWKLIYRTAEEMAAVAVYNPSKTEIDVASLHLSSKTTTLSSLTSQNDDVHVSQVAPREQSIVIT